MDDSSDDGVTTPESNLTPDELYERSWALSVFKQAEAMLQIEEETAGRGAQFKRLQAFLVEDHDGDKYQAAGRDLRLSSEAVATAVHRLRLRFWVVLQTVVGDTFGSDQVEAGMRRLLAALRPK